MGVRSGNGTAAGETTVTDDLPVGSSNLETAIEHTDPLSLGTVFELLANRDRRFALYALRTAQNEALALDALIDEVVTLQAAVDDDPVCASRITDVAVDLYHWHLPVLNEVGIIECDPRHDTIRYLPGPRLETWLLRTHRDEITDDRE